MRRIAIFLCFLMMLAIGAPQVKASKAKKITKTYKVTIFNPEKRVYTNVSNLDFGIFLKTATNQPYSSKIIEFYEEPNKRHIIIGEGWIAEENFK